MKVFEMLTRSKFDGCNDIDEIIIEMWRIKIHMSQHRAFELLAPEVQHDLCTTIYCMITDTITGRLLKIHGSDSYNVPGLYDIKRKLTAIITKQ